MGLWPDVGDNSDFNGLLQGNFGYSQFYKQDVIKVISDPMKNTIFINIFSTILALGITIPLGIFCAGRVCRNEVVQRIHQKRNDEKHKRHVSDTLGNIFAHLIHPLYGVFFFLFLPRRRPR